MIAERDARATPRRQYIVDVSAEAFPRIDIKLDRRSEDSLRSAGEKSPTPLNQTAIRNCLIVTRHADSHSVTSAGRPLAEVSRFAV